MTRTAAHFDRWAMLHAMLCDREELTALLQNPELGMFDPYVEQDRRELDSILCEHLQNCGGLLGNW